MLNVEVAPGIHRIRLPLAGNALRSVNSYLIEGSDGPVLVDCGWNTPDTLEALRNQLRDLGLGLEDVPTLVATHCHTDHYGLAGTLKGLVPIRLLMHSRGWWYVRTHLADSAGVKSSAEWLERNGLLASAWAQEGKGALEILRRFSVVAPDVELEDGDTIQVGQRTLRVIWTPGHAQGHVCLYDAEARLLFSGDHVLDPITPHVSFSRPGIVDPLGCYMESLRKIATLEVDLVLPGHGKAFAGFQRRVQELLAARDEREASVLEALSRGPATAAEVAEHIPWTQRQLPLSRLPAFQQRMALGETLSHLEKLRVEGRVASQQRNGRIYQELVLPFADSPRP